MTPPNVRATNSRLGLFARTMTCPSCEGTIPLSPNWRLDSKGTGIRVMPDTTSGTCSFEIVTRASDQSPGNRLPGQGNLPLPELRGNNPRRIHLQEAQAGRLGHQLYCIIYRDSWHPRPSQEGHPSGPRLPVDSAYQDQTMTTRRGWKFSWRNW